MSGGGGPRPLPLLPDRELFLATDPTHPLQPPLRSLEAVTELFLLRFAEEDELEQVLPRSGVPRRVTSSSWHSQEPNTPSLQTQLLSKLGSTAFGMAAGPTASI